MSANDHFKTLYAYHWHVNRQLSACAAKLAPADYMGNPGYGHGSIHDLLFHLLRTLYAWRVALENGRQPSPLRAEDYPDLATVEHGFAHEQDAWTALLETLGDADVEGTIELATVRGDVFQFRRWRVLQHLVLHGMQHHTEIAQLLTAKGQSPGDIDFIFYRG
jgi:uncharacterized damage-inducible protein DinB